MSRKFVYANGHVAVAQDGSTISSAFVEVIDPKTGKTPTWASGETMLFVEFNTETWAGRAYAPGTMMWADTKDRDRVRRGEQVESIVFLDKTVPVTGFYELREVERA